MIFVAHFSERRVTSSEHHSHLTRGKAKGGIVAFFRNDGRPLARGAYKLATSAELQLNIVNGHPQGN